jgi:hypothetical protein
MVWVCHILRSLHWLHGPSSPIDGALFLSVLHKPLGRGVRREQGDVEYLEAPHVARELFWSRSRQGENNCRGMVLPLGRA